MGVYGDDASRKKKRSSTKEAEGGFGDEFKGWINVNLSDGEKETFQKWFEGSSFWENFVHFASDGCSVSVKPNVRDGGFLAVAIHRRTSSPNYGLGVSARARTADVALGRLIFVLTVLSREESWEAVQPMADPDRW